MLDRVTVDHIAELAKLDLTDAEREAMRVQLSPILAYMDQLADLDMAPSAGVGVIGPVATRLREDVAAPALDRAAILDLAPQIAAGQVRVPPLMD
jgi:aspartyl-tRNA(Asn)/glutamyl-tRNA(Gln) amidotransferase subunit C